LCHNGAKYTAEALDTLIKNLKAQGYELVPVSQLIYPGVYGEDYDIDYEGRQYVRTSGE
jgi:peptidoglycan/xylan/chitin deacetylase (PgdA/CDA1 family)